jgi:hypothetical protein
MSRNIIFVLMYHHHKLLDLNHMVMFLTTSLKVLQMSLIMLGKPISLCYIKIVLCIIPCFQENCKLKIYQGLMHKIMIYVIV